MARGRIRKKIKNGIWTDLEKVGKQIGVIVIFVGPLLSLWADYPIKILLSTPEITTVAKGLISLGWIVFIMFLYLLNRVNNW